MEDSEIIAGFDALFGAMTPEQHARITAYLVARLGVGTAPMVPAEVVPAKKPTAKGDYVAVAGGIEYADDTGPGIEWQCDCKTYKYANFRWSDIQAIATGAVPPGWHAPGAGPGFDAMYESIIKCCDTPTRLGVQRSVAERWLREHGKAPAPPATPAPPAAMTAESVAAWLLAQTTIPVVIVAAILKIKDRHVETAAPTAQPIDHGTAAPPPLLKGRLATYPPNWLSGRPCAPAFDHGKADEDIGKMIRDNLAEWKHRQEMQQGPTNIPGQMLPGPTPPPGLRIEGTALNGFPGEAQTISFYRDTDGESDWKPWVLGANALLWSSANEVQDGGVCENIPADYAQNLGPIGGVFR